MRPSVSRSVLLGVLTTLLVAAPVAAGDFRGAQTVSVGGDETVQDDLYVAAGTVTLAGAVDGDATIGGGTVTVSGPVSGSVNVAGGTVDVLGEVGGAVRVSGGTVRVAGAVARDVVVFGGTVTIEPNATIEGDVAGGVGTLTVGGRVGGDLLAAGGTIRISGTGSVEGAVEASVENLVMDDGARVGGDVTYTSAREAEIASGAEIGGSIERREPARGPADALAAPNPILSYLGLLAGMLLFGWSLLAIRPRLVLGSGATLRDRPLLSLGVGVGAWIGQFVLVLLLVVVGALLSALAGVLGGAFFGAALIVVLLIVIALILSSVPVAMAVGAAVLPGDRSPYLAYAAGAAILAAVLVLAGLVPALGAIATLLVWILGLGAYTVYLWRTRERPWGTVAVPPAPPPAASDPPWPEPAAPPA